VARLDRTNDRIVVRIVYDGPPTAGKTTSMRALARHLGRGEVQTPAEAGGRTLFFDWLEYTGGHFEGRPVHCQIVSVPGQDVLAERRRRIVAAADAVVFVADTTQAGLAESRQRLGRLRLELDALPEPSVGVVLQANKRDRPDAAALDVVHGSGCLVVESAASRGEGVREAFIFAVRLALDRVRELVRAGGLAALGDGDTFDALLHDLRGLRMATVGEGLWPPEVPLPTSPASGVPRTPDATVPSGFIWPPVTGRVLLQEATVAVQETRELTPAQWTADAAGWRFHSAPLACFADVDAGRTALLRWAQAHAALAPWMSADRLVVLGPTGDGAWRLWQVVRHKLSLWGSITRALRTPTDLPATVQRAREACVTAARRWTRIPCDLPCTLETVGATDGDFIGFLPEADRITPARPADHEARLLRQLDALVRGEREGRAPR
jgi:GTPase SAR1 family protein